MEPLQPGVTKRAKERSIKGIDLGEDQLLLTVPGIPSERKVSAFVLGEGGYLTYAADGCDPYSVRRLKATIGRSACAQK